MSLQLRLNFIIILICVATLVVGSAVTVVNAKHAVYEEVTSSLLLAGKLLNQQTSKVAPLDLESARHLRVVVVDSKDGNRRLTQKGAIDSSVSALFVWFVYPEFEQLSLELTPKGGGQQQRLIADPSDEILEAWQEVKVFILLLVLSTILISVSVFIVIGRALRPVDKILSAFVELEKEDYSIRLDGFKLPEFSRIASGINHLSDKLMLSKEENRQLNKHALDVREAERHHLARELHDEMGQSLTAIKALSASVKPSNSSQLSSLKAIDEICSHLFDVIRNRMCELSPPLLSELGFQAAVEELIEKWAGKAEVTLALDEHVDELVGDNGIHYYRIIQESLTNTLRHSGATKVSVSLERTSNNTLQLTVQDNGKGFASNLVNWGGLYGIKERVNNLGGIMEIATESGTAIMATCPFSA